MKYPNKYTAKLWHKYLSIFILILLACANLSGCVFSNSQQLQRTESSRTFFALDTVIQLTIYDADKSGLLDECQTLVDEYESLLSATLPASDIYRINHADGEWVTVSDDTLILLNTALNYCRQSDGIIDITILPVKDLWNFTGENPAIPSENALSEALSHVDYTCVEINGNTVRLSDSNAMLDLGFIAKGYIADKLRQFLVDNQVESALLSLGGSIMAIGQKPDGSSFKVGIQKPFAATSTAITTVTISGNSPSEYCSVVTSGIYERYFEADGKIFHHILDSSTGYPIDNELASVTILSNSSTEGDALSTLCLALGSEKASELIASCYGVEAIFITRDNSIIHVSGKADAS
jgi:thiamine biosynthesis lipoprotein